jgi:hypothetical protein
MDHLAHLNDEFQFANASWAPLDFSIRRVACRYAGVDSGF